MIDFLAAGPRIMGSWRFVSEMMILRMINLIKDNQLEIASENA